VDDTAILALTHQAVYSASMAVEEWLSAGIEPLRAVVGAGADTLLSPASLADWEPSKQKLAWGMTRSLLLRRQSSHRQQKSNKTTDRGFALE